MKRATFLFLLATLLILLVTSQLCAIDLKKGETAAVSPRASDLSIDIDLIGGDGGVYRPGKEIQVSFQTSEDAYVFVYNVDSDGYVHLLYPDGGKPVLAKGRTTHFLPEPGTGISWESGDRTGIEYIHAVAVVDRSGINDDELYFLAQNDRLSEEKRFRVDIDPFLAFNMIDEELVTNAEQAPPATAYTYFYVNRHVEYPRYLCSKCHTPEKITDPYAMECSEIVIEKLSYSDDPHYPYPPLYDIRHAGEAKRADDDSGSSGEKWLDEDDDETDVALLFSLGLCDYPFYTWPYYGGFSFGLYPFAYDPFWGNFGFSFYWGYDYWWPSYGWGYPPYSYWGCHYYYPYWDCDHYYGGCDGGYCYGYPSRTGYAQRDVVRRRSLDYAQTNKNMHRTRTMEKSRVAKTRTENVAQRLDKSALQKRAIEHSMDRPTNLARADRIAAKSHEAARTIIYGGEKTARGTTRDANRTMRSSEANRGRSGSRIAAPPGRTGSAARGRSQSTQRDVIRHAAPDWRSPGRSRETAPGVRPQNSSPRERSGSQERPRSTVDRRRTSASHGGAPASSSVNRSSSSPSRASSPARSVSAPARSSSHGAAHSAAPSRSSGGGGGRSRSR